MELMVVVAIVAVLAAIALPGYQRVRLHAREAAVVANLQAMAKTQELFWLNPVPLPPSSLTQTDRRYARLHELNGFARNIFGASPSPFFLDGAQVRYAMVPPWPSSTSLLSEYTIEAHGVGGYDFIYSLDQTGKVVKVR